MVIFYCAAKVLLHFSRTLRFDIDLLTYKLRKKVFMPFPILPFPGISFYLNTFEEGGTYRKVDLAFTMRPSVRLLVR